MLQDIQRILYHESTILDRLDELAEALTDDYRGKDLTVIAILNGSFIFMADLLRRVPLPLQVDCLNVSSYHGAKSTGRVAIRQNQLTAELEGRHVLILDDILDSGTTLHIIREHLAATSSSLSLKVCVLLRKEIDRPRRVEADYVGFDIPNEFVVGYGLDYNGRYRNLPFIGVLTNEAIRRHSPPPTPEARDQGSQRAPRRQGSEQRIHALRRSTIRRPT
ncbi:MAG TPA: hypoxanthine phosphoribosyltransferase [Terrimicrobiaceae bacterium]